MSTAYCAVDVLQQGRAQGPGGAAIAWKIGTEGSKRKIGRGTTIDKVAKHNAFQGVMPSNPTHQDITSERFVHGILKCIAFCISQPFLVSILIHQPFVSGHRFCLLWFDPMNDTFETFVAGLFAVPGQGKAFMSATCRPGPCTFCLKKKYLQR